MKIEELNKVTKYYRDRGYRGDFTGKKGHERLIKGMELLGIKVPKIMREYRGNRAGGVGLATPTTDATSAPSGSGPKAAQGRKQTKKVAKVQKGLARPIVDPRDEAMKEIQLASQKKGEVLPMMQAAKGVTAITVGIGAKPDLMKAEKGEPPIGATKKEVADDQHVMMSEGELVVPANVVRYHGLGTYEAMRKEALMGLESMEDAGQIEYVGNEETSKTNDGGLLKAQTGVTPLGTAPTAASAQFAGLAAPNTSQVSYTPLRLNQGIPMYDAQGNIIGYQPNTQPTPTRTTGIGALFTGDPKSVVAPNVGDYQESVEADFTKPPEGTGSTTTSAGVGGDTGGGRSFTAPTPNLTPQQQTQRFDDMVAAEASKLPTPAANFEKTDFDDYINRRTPGDQGTGIMGKAADAVDNFAGFVLSPITGYQDKQIRETAANRLIKKQYTSEPEYNSLVKTINLSPYGDEKDDVTLADTIAKAKETTFDSDAADKFRQAKVAAKEEMSAPVIFKEDTPVDRFLKGPQPSPEAQAAREREKELLASISPDSVGGSGGLSTKEIRELDAKRASDTYNESLQQARDAELARNMNPVIAAERMRMQLGGGDTSQMSGAEREEEQRRQEDAARRAARMDERIALSARQSAESSSDSGGDSGGGGSSGGGGVGSGGSDDKIVCTEMYRQTQLIDWQKAMKVWDIYQRRHLTPEHQVGYHWLFRPYVTGMQSSNLLTRLGAFLAKKRTQHLKHILTKGKAKDDLFGNVFCKLIHPTVYIAGKIKTFLTKI